MPDHDAVIARFRRDLDAWRAANPGWTQYRQLAAFSPSALHERSGGGELYRRLMIEAGYLAASPEASDA